MGPTQLYSLYNCGTESQYMYIQTFITFKQNRSYWQSLIRTQHALCKIQLNYVSCVQPLKLPNVHLCIVWSVKVLYHCVAS